MNVLVFLVISVTGFGNLGLTGYIPPRIITRNGNIYFEASPFKNISFRTTWNAGVIINQMDVLPTLQKAKQATKLLDNYQKSFSPISDRLDALELRMSSGSDVNITGSSTAVLNRMQLRRLSRRINALQRRLGDIQILLYKDECVSNPCKNGGICQDSFNDYICKCQQGWEGHDCLEDINECSRFAGTDLGCQNGATCVNKPGSYECLCQSGFVGLHCTRKKADCSLGGIELCGHGICVNQNNQQGYKCICDQGWKTDGVNLACTVDVDECNEPHLGCLKNPKVQCKNIPGSFFCGHCPAGYTGNGYTCEDIDECAINNGGCSLNPMVPCINTPGSSNCGLCPPGYAGNGISCIFQGVCNVNNGGCHHLAQCRDNPVISSTYVDCICPLGYVGNGRGPNGCITSSLPFNPCASNPCVNGGCAVNNVTRDYVCNCRRRYTGRNCDIVKDPCGSKPCLNEGTCQNVGIFTYTCTCKTGFIGRRCEREVQGCGGVIRQDSGTLKYPSSDFLSYGHSLSCAWTIETNSTNILNVTFTKFDIEETVGCRADWLQIHDGKSSASRSLGRFCGSKLPLGGNILTTHNIIYLWFRSNARIAKDGFELTWNSTNPVCGGNFVLNTSSYGSIESPGSPGDYPPNRDCYWSLRIPYGKRIYFHIFSLEIGDNSDCSKDYLEFYCFDGQVIAKFCNSSNPSPFYSTDEVVYIHFRSDSQDAYPGFRLSYSLVEGISGCGNVFTLSEGTIQSSQDMSSVGYMCEYKIQQNIKTKIKISFTRFELIDSPGCTIEYVKVYEGPNEESPLIGRYCGKSLPSSFMSLSNQVLIISHLMQTTNGWKLLYKKVCGHKYTEPTGEIKMSDVSTKPKNCVFQIERPVGFVINLALKITFIEPVFNYNCLYNHVEIRNGDNENSPLIGRFCTNKNEIITSTFNHLWIQYKGVQRYRNGSSYLSPSFEASYTSRDLGCGGVLRNKIGNIASPSHLDGFYPSHTKCTWVIIAPPNNVIQLTWMTFNVEQSYECGYDNVEVYDNSTGLGKGDLMGRYCGFTLPPVLLTLSNIMTIIFTTDVTINLDGFLASYIFIHESNVCGGNYHTAAGVIKSPKYPDLYPTNRECVWTITVQSGQQIMLNITDFNLESYIGCRYDFLTIRNGGTSSSPLIGKYCGENIPKLIPSHTNKLYLFFKSDLSRSSRGFKITWSSTETGCGGKLTSSSGSIISPNYPEPYNRNTECMWQIIVSAGSLIQIIFSDINLERHNSCLADYVEIFDGLTTTSNSLGKYCSEVTKQITSTGHQMLIKFRADIAFQGRGFQLHYNTICHNTLKGFYGVIESPNYSGRSYPQNQDCLWDIIVSDNNKINITFSEFALDRSLTYENSSCKFDYVEILYEAKDDDYFDQEGNSYILYDSFCGSKTPGLISLDSDHARIHFVSDKLLMGTGFRLEWQIYGCGGNLKQNAGTIQTPNYPKPYPPAIKCEWQIEVEFGSSIVLNFTHVDIEKDSSCSFDYIKIYNGLNSSYNLLTQICHQSKPTIVTSTGNFMYIEFKADESYQGKGFTAFYVTHPTKCGGELTAKEGSIFSPNYPKNYDKNDTCFWLINVEESHSVVLDFKDVDLLQSENCTKNYVKFYDGPTEAYPVLGKICGSTTSNISFASTFNEMFVEFRANAYQTTKGFMAHYIRSCGSRITTQGSGVIRASFDDFNEYETNCTWTIIATDPSLHVRLTISHMQLRYAYCYEEKGHINIYGGESVSSPLLGSYCGSKIPPTLVSDGNAITISLESEVQFFATYSVLDSHCGGTLTSSEGYFATPGYPKEYASDIQCEWTLHIAAGNHITLSFIYFHLRESKNCNTDYLEIRKNNASGPLLGIYCGENMPVNITHEGSLWLVYKGSKDNTLDSLRPLPADLQNPVVTPKGFHAEYSLEYDNELRGPRGRIESPMYPNKFYDYGIFSWRISVGTTKKILLTFKEFYVETDDNDCYITNIEIFDGVDGTANKLNTLCGTTIPDPIKSSTNVLYIKAEYNSFRFGTKFVIEWLEINKPLEVPRLNQNTSGDCSLPGGEYIQQVNKPFVIKSPGYPRGYKPNLKCEWIFYTKEMNHLKIYFSDFSLADSFSYLRSSVCMGDYVSLYKNSATEARYLNNENWELIRTICTKNNSYGIIESTNWLKIDFVTNMYINGTGFKAEIDEACGGSLTGPTGYIIFSNSTLIGYECQWNITVGSGKTIELTFEEMNIAHDKQKGCNNFLMIRNGKFSDSPFLGKGKYCGTEIPSPLESTGNHLYLKYKGSATIVGFKLKYQQKSVVCGGETILTDIDNSIEIYSPNYDNVPPSYSECTWIIRAPPGESLKIDFVERFDLTFRYECDLEYVEVRDGGTEYSPLIGRYCKEKPSTQFSTDNIIFVKFFTQAEDPKNGFKAVVSLATCGGTLRGFSGEIKHPHLISNIKKFNCTWHIEGTSGHFLKISFSKFEVRKLVKCLPSNVLTITEKHPVLGNVTSLGQFCGKTLPPMIQSSDNEVTIDFVGEENDKFVLKFETSRSECGGELRVESGVIQSPGYPVMSYSNRNCAWKIIVPEGRRITFEIQDLDFDGNLYNYQGIAIYEGLTVRTPITTLRAGTSKSKYESSSNKMSLFFWSFHNTEHRGFKANFSSNNPTICSGDFNAKNGLITQPSVRNSSYHCEYTHNASPFLNETLAITISFKHNDIAQDKVYKYFTFFIIKERNQNILTRLFPTSKQPVTVRSPYITTNLIAHTNSENQLNFTISYKTHKCGGMIKGEQEGIITSPNFPNQPTESFECAWLINVNKEEQIKITVTDMNFGDDCEKNFLTIHNGWSRLLPRIGQFCKNNKPEPFTSQAKSLFMEYKWEKGSGGTGFKMKFEAIANGCGGIYHDKLSTIQTPNYGKEYPINTECLWEIRSDSGYHIELHFIDRFYIEETDNCTNDYVEIWNWKNDDWVSFGRKCGRNVSEIFKSSGEKMKILFRSNDRIGASGFKARWEWQCGGTFEAAETPRYIVSPRYPLNYPSNMKCIYTITTKSNVMVLKFEDFELSQGDSDCSFENVTITSNQMTAFTRSRSIYCGKNKPPIFRIMKNVVVTFNSNRYSMSKKGFKFMYSDESCGGIINSPSVIETPKYNYVLTGIIGYPKVRCFWNITAPPKQVVILKVTTLKLLGLSYSRICYGEKLTVYDGLIAKSTNHLLSLCGDVINYPPITAESGKMFVELDASPYSFKGFRAEVYFSHGPEEGCGGTVNLTDTKYIQSPDLSNLDCGWKIIAPRDFSILIHFTEVNIPGTCSDADKNSVLCGCSFIEVHDGGSPQSDSIIKLCNTSDTRLESRIFTTSGNNAFIRFTLMDHKSNVFKASLSAVLSDCGSSVLNVTQEIKTLTSPHYPSKYLSNTRCNWMFYSQNPIEKIHLHFVDFDLSQESAIQSFNDTCAGDKIEINEGYNKRLITEGFGPGAVHRGQAKSVLMHFNNFLTKHTFCSTGDSPFDYYSSGTSLGVSFISTNSLKKGSGFKLEYSLAGCNRNYTDLQGRFLYSKKLDCVITITVPQNRTISLYFQIFFMYQISANCTDGAFEVRENNSTGNILSKDCGMRLPSPIFSFTNKIYIHVWSIRHMPFSRYDVIYTSTDQGRGCGGEIFNFKGKFSSPLYPNEFRNDTICTWNIKVPANLQAVLQFIDFDVQGECDQSYVKVITYSDGVDRESTFCKNDKPAIIRSSNNLIVIKYYSSIHNVGKGWMAAFQGVTNDITELL